MAISASPLIEKVRVDIRQFSVEYFRSGWAFLTPYLATYLVYAGMGWSVHPAGSSSSALSLRTAFQLLHGLHLVMAAATCGWGGAQWRGDWMSRLRPLLPWIALALLFGIPGAYREWPSDPWEHIARINTWSGVRVVTDHPAWFKSGYFLAYSFVGAIRSFPQQLAGLDAYYTAGCLLLSWQYYRLFRTLGMEPGMAWVATAVQMLVMGNNIFSFHRYYGLASTMLAQLAAVAATRIVAERLVSAAPGEASIRSPVASRLRLTGALLALAALIAFNHVQGFGIALFGIVALAAWRLVQRGRSWALALAAFGLLASVGAAWFMPRHPLVEQSLVPGRWLTTWMGFNFSSPDSPALARAWVIWGGAGLVALVASILRYRQPGSWLVFTPPLLLAFPCVGLPVANALMATGEPDGILTFHRLLFSAPIALPIVELSVATGAWLSQLANRSRVARVGRAIAIPSLLLIWMLLPSGAPTYNRLYHAIAIPPADLEMAAIVHQADSLRKLDAEYYGLRDGNLRLVAPSGLGFVIAASGRRNVVEPVRLFASRPGDSPSARTERLIQHTLPRTDTADTVRMVPDPFTLTTPLSQAAVLSGHWLAAEVSLDHAGAREIARDSRTRETRLVDNSHSR